MPNFIEERNRLTAALKKAQEDASRNEQSALDKLERDFNALKGVYAFYKSLQVFEDKKAFLTSCPSKVEWVSVSYVDNDYINPGSTWDGFVADHRFNAHSKEENDQYIKKFGPKGYENYRATVADLIFTPLGEAYHASDKGDRDSITKTMTREGLFIRMDDLYQLQVREAEKLSFEQIEGYIAEQKAKREKEGMSVTVTTAASLKTACDEMLKVWMTPPPAPPKPPVKLCNNSWPMGGFRKR